MIREFFLNYMIIEKYIMSFPDAQIENLNLLKKIQVFYFILLLMLVDDILVISKKGEKLDKAHNFFFFNFKIYLFKKRKEGNVVFDGPIKSNKNPTQKRPKRNERKYLSFPQV